MTPGTRIGPYEVISPLGTGGMGEVFRARDSRLGRDVALKLLLPDATFDDDRIARFEQESRAAAALNHPNIIALYDVGTYASRPYLVVELLDGSTVRDRLASGAVPVRKAIEYAHQIALGLAAAHEKGIVHRDLKPENIFITADDRVKILDFGLAKLTQLDPGAAGATAVPTTPRNTVPGMVMGTVGYMAPEQVRGLAADYRADIFAFGAVLYEMLSGERAFRGETPMDAMMAIAREDPASLSAARATVPAWLVRVVERCLEKDPARRFQSTRDLAFALAESSSGTSLSTPTAAPGRSSNATVPWTIATLALVAALGVTIAWWMSDTTTVENTSPPAVTFAIAAPGGTRFTNLPGTPAHAIAPDGSAVVLAAPKTDANGAFIGQSLWLRSLNSLEAIEIGGTDRASLPFWSPDSRAIGFFADGKLKRINAVGGSAVTICDAPSPAGGAWNRDGVILVASRSGPLLRVSSSGGTPSPATSLDETANEVAHRWPQFLPDGRHFIYTTAGESPAIYVSSLDSLTRSLLTRSDAQGFYTAGHLLFVRQGVLLAQRFDVETGALSGDTMAIAGELTTAPAGAVPAAVSDAGIVSYYRTLPAPTQLTWYSRSGGTGGTIGDSGPFRQVALSPNGLLVAVQRNYGQLAEIWVANVKSAGGVPTRFLAGSGQAGPVWSADSRELAYFQNEGGATSFLQRTVDGTKSAPLPGNGVIEDWSRDGRYVLYLSGGLRALPVSGDQTPIRVADSGALLDEAQFSPDGRWVAYNATDSGRPEIYVQPFPGPADRVRLSDAGGVQPKWRADGRELFYLSTDGTMMAVGVTLDGASVVHDPPKALFKTTLVPEAIIDQYAVTADGQRFLMLAPTGESKPGAITVLVNWKEGLRK